MTDDVLAPGVTTQQVKDAVMHSGYPLQTWVAARLLRLFDTPPPGAQHIALHEEWSYPDDVEPTQRSMDLHATIWLAEKRERQLVRPHLALFIECKQAELPFVFFQGQVRPRPGTFPLLAGLRYDDLAVHTNNDLSTYSVPLIEFFDLHEHPFVTADAFVSATFARTSWRKSQTLELGASDTYNGIVLPLIKAYRHFARISEPRSTRLFFDVYANILICVVDAPLATVAGDTDNPTVQAVPWVRLVRREQAVVVDPIGGPNLYLIDFVHKTYFDEYLKEYVMPFAALFAERVGTHDRVLADGRAFVPEMRTRRYSHLHSDARPLSVTRKSLRGLLDGIEAWVDAASRGRRPR